MADLELLISRYLDGELTLPEQVRLQSLLAKSPEARALLREMSALSRAARRSPLLHEPPRHLENALFAKLREEGLHAPVPETLASTPAPAPPRWYGARMLRSALAGMAILVAFVGDSYLCNLGTTPPARSSGAFAARVGSSHGEPVAPPSLTIPSSARRTAAPGERHHAIAAGGGADQAPVSMTPPPPAHPEPAPPSVPAEEPAPTLARIVPELQPDRVVIPVEELAMASLTEESEAGGGHLAASFRPGIAMIDRGERIVAREMNFQLGMELKGGHQVSLIVGTAPSLTETRHENTYEPASSPARAASPDDGADGAIAPRELQATVQLPEYERSLRNEPWVGVGYNYAISPAKGLSVAVGVNAGASASVWRVGGELPVRYKVMRNISIEGAVSVSAINPRNHDVERFTVTDAPDHFVYRGSVERPSFVSYGMQVGIRVDLSGNH